LVKTAYTSLTSNTLTAPEYRGSSDYLKASLTASEEETDNETVLGDALEEFLFAFFDFEKKRSGTDYLSTDDYEDELSSIEDREQQVEIFTVKEVSNDSGNEEGDSLEIVPGNEGGQFLINYSEPQGCGYLLESDPEDLSLKIDSCRILNPEISSFDTPCRSNHIENDSPTHNLIYRRYEDLASLVREKKNGSHSNSININNNDQNILNDASEYRFRVLSSELNLSTERSRDTLSESGLSSYSKSLLNFLNRKRGDSLELTDILNKRKSWGTYNIYKSFKHKGSAPGNKLTSSFNATAQSERKKVPVRKLRRDDNIKPHFIPTLLMKPNEVRAKKNKSRQRKKKRITSISKSTKVPSLRKLLDDLKNPYRKNALSTSKQAKSSSRKRVSRKAIDRSNQEQKARHANSTKRKGKDECLNLLAGKKLSMLSNIDFINRVRTDLSELSMTDRSLKPPANTGLLRGSIPLARSLKKYMKTRDQMLTQKQGGSSLKDKIAGLLHNK